MLRDDTIIMIALFAMGMMPASGSPSVIMGFRGLRAAFADALAGVVVNIRPGVAVGSVFRRAAAFVLTGAGMVDTICVWGPSTPVMAQGRVVFLATLLANWPAHAGSRASGVILHDLPPAFAGALMVIFIHICPLIVMIADAPRGAASVTFPAVSTGVRDGHAILIMRLGFRCAAAVSLTGTGMSPGVSIRFLVGLPFSPIVVVLVQIAVFPSTALADSFIRTSCIAAPMAFRYNND